MGENTNTSQGGIIDECKIIYSAFIHITFAFVLASVLLRPCLIHFELWQVEYRLETFPLHDVCY